MVDHNVVGLDVSVDNFYDIMAIVKGLKHVCEIELHIHKLEANLFDILRLDAIFNTFSFINFINALNIIAQTSLRVVFLNKVYVILLRIINDLLQPNNIRMLKFL